jgi:hypothetical protein
LFLHLQRTCWLSCLPKPPYPFTPNITTDQFQNYSLCDIESRLRVPADSPGMSAAAAAAWVHFADISSAALHRPKDFGVTPTGLAPTLVAAVDGVIAQGLARLLPAQLLSAAVGAFQARLACLGDTLAALFDQLAAMGAMAESEDKDDEEDGVAGLTTDMEASLAGTLEVGAEWLALCNEMRAAGWVCSQVIYRSPPLLSTGYLRCCGALQRAAAASLPACAACAALAVPR